jgi:hypothetical protein
VAVKSVPGRQESASTRKGFFDGNADPSNKLGLAEREKLIRYGAMPPSPPPPDMPESEGPPKKQ